MYEVEVCGFESGYPIGKFGFTVLECFSMADQDNEGRRTLILRKIIDHYSPMEREGDG